MSGRVLDASALHDLTVGRTVYAAAFIAAANDLGIALAVPAAALQDAWASADLEDYPFLELLLGLPLTVVDALDAPTAEGSGVIARDAHQSGRWDAGAAHAVHCSRVRGGWPVLTANPVPIRAVDVAVPIELLPN